MHGCMTHTSCLPVLSRPGTDVRHVHAATGSVACMHHNAWRVIDTWAGQQCMHCNQSKHLLRTPLSGNYFGQGVTDAHHNTDHRGRFASAFLIGLQATADNIDLVHQTGSFLQVNLEDQQFQGS